MYKLRTHDSYDKEIYAPENAPIINIQCGDPLIDLLDNWIDPESEVPGGWSVADLLQVVKRDLESEEAKERFLEGDLNRLFEALGMED